jgi:transposase
MLTGRVEFVIGVDSHKYRHTAAAVNGLGGVLQVTDIPTSLIGYKHLLDWANQFARGRRVWAIEGTGSYGAGLTDHLQAKGELVIEVDRPKRSSRKDGAKSDDIDAVRAARDALTAKRLAQPRQRGERQALRVLKTTRKQAVDIHSQAVVHLKSLVVSAPEQLRTRLRGLTANQLVRVCVGLRMRTAVSVEVSATIKALRATAKRAQAAEAEVAELETELRRLVTNQAPAELLSERGVGAVVAAELLCAWSHPGRLHSEAAFARLAGVAPVEASSGQVVRHRLSRGGDRQLNCALRRVVLTRLASDSRTHAYVNRRRAEGKSDREIQRCLKRYVARHLFRLLEATA